MEKPIKPIEPNTKDYSREILGIPNNEDHPFIKAYRKYQQDLKKYEQDMETYNQIKLIKLVKNSTEKYCLKNLTINRK